MEVYVARQPIFNKDKEIFGYELLFRESMSNFFPDIDGNTATSKLLHNSFFTIGIEEITGSKLAFINFTQELLINRMPLMFPRERVVVEILEDVEPQEDVVTACQEIAKRGYSIAMDDFFYKSELDPLIALTNIIKFDLRATSFEEMEGYVKNLANGDLRFLAEKVETHDEFNRALKIGCHYFQGYFFSKPEILKGRDFSGAQMNLLEIMTEANKENFSFQNLEIWKKAIEIGDKLLDIADELERKRMYRFAEQVRAAGLSISNNISEGSGSFSNKEFAQFLNIARRSTFENANMVIVFERRSLINSQTRDVLLDDLEQECKMITGFIRNLKTK